ncbi:MAG: 7-cyano-7-deazaguanine synthase QueC [Planctomycetia bacterium TMED53]|nr:MAG: 7-cyano-7-deazaguanine synthase QueC [Planctomycetia bacterium TMED53]
MSQQTNPQGFDSIALASGGLDSSTVLSIAVDRGFRPLPLAFRYGQKHEIELDSLRKVTSFLGLPEPLILELPYQAIGGSALLGEGAIPAEPQDGAQAREEIPSTYVPARNLVFLSIATAVAEARGIRDLWIGVNALDYSGYPDCRPEFLKAFLETVELGTRDGATTDDTVNEPYWRMHAPLAEMSKAEIIQTAAGLGLDLSLTHSCYDPRENGLACGICDSCGLRKRGFEEAGIKDPTIYA